MEFPRRPKIPGYDVISFYSNEHTIELWTVRGKRNIDDYFTAVIFRYDEYGRQFYRRAKSLDQVLEEEKIDGLLKCVQKILIEAEPGRWCFLYEYAKLGTLTEMRRREAPRYEEMQQWLLSLTITVRKLHQQRLMHRGIHPSNIFFLSRSDLRLGNFLHIRNIPEENIALTRLHHIPMTFIPPECDSMIITDTEYDEGVDVWSLGCVAFFMYYGRIMERNKFPPALDIEKIRERPLREFIEMCCSPREIRPNAEQLLATCELLAGTTVEEFRKKIVEIIADVRRAKDTRDILDAKLEADNGLKFVLRRLNELRDSIPTIKEDISPEETELRKIRDELIDCLRIG